MNRPVFLDQRPEGPHTVNDLRVDLGEGRHMRMRRAGEGSVSIIFEAGWGQWSPAWARTQPLIAEQHATWSFDRLGLGKSDPAPPDRSVFQIVDEIQAALEAAHAAGPFVYVGHGFGAVHARALAHRDPRVIGLVLIDPVVEALGSSRPFKRWRDLEATRWTRTLRYTRPGPLSSIALALFHRRPASFRRLPKDAKKELKKVPTATTVHTVLGELGGLDDGMHVLGSVGVPKIPFEVLSAEEDWLPNERRGQTTTMKAGQIGDRHRTDDGAETAVQTMHRKFAESSALGMWSKIHGSSHHIHIDQPSAVFEAVRRVLAR